jgi:hypothetical protein
MCKCVSYLQYISTVLVGGSDYATLVGVRKDPRTRWELDQLGFPSQMNNRSDSVTLCFCDSVLRHVIAIQPRVWNVCQDGIVNLDWENEVIIAYLYSMNSNEEGRTRSSPTHPNPRTRMDICISIVT